MRTQFISRHKKGLAIALAACIGLGTALPAQAIDLRYASAPDGAHCQYVYSNEEALAVRRLALFENQFNTVAALTSKRNVAGMQEAWNTWIQDYLYVANTLGTADYDASKRVSQQEQDNRLSALLQLGYGPRGVNNDPHYYANAGSYYLNFDESVLNKFDHGQAADWVDAEYYGPNNPSNASRVVIATDPGGIEDFTKLIGVNPLLPNDDWINLMRPQAALVDKACAKLTESKDINLIASIPLNPRVMLWANDVYYRWRELLLLRDIIGTYDKSSPRLFQMIEEVNDTALNLEKQADQQRVAYDQQEQLKYSNTSLISRGTQEAQKGLVDAFLKLITSS
ncbi:MAG: hypothetical protein Q3962_07985 [Corynebacterium sp.]|nr:hypothetical protein [Corynebacterium sp.]